MSVKVYCDACKEQAAPIWGEFIYTAGGGRHGAEVFHFCFYCVDKIRAAVVDAVPRSDLDGVSPFMLYEDHDKRDTIIPKKKQGE